MTAESETADRVEALEAFGEAALEHRFGGSGHLLCLGDLFRAMTLQAHLERDLLLVLVDYRDG